MVYLDDITMVRYSIDRNKERRRQHARRFLEDVKQVFDERNLLTHKDQGPASELEVLGCEVETAGSPDIPGPICIRPNPKKLEKLIAATEFIIRKRKIRVRQLQKVLGLWTFFFGLRRGFFSIFDKVYSPQYSRMFAPTLPGGEPAPCAPNDRFVVLQADAILELRAAINIAPLLVAEVSQEIDRYYRFCERRLACRMRSVRGVGRAHCAAVPLHTYFCRASTNPFFVHGAVRPHPKTKMARGCEICI